MPIQKKYQLLIVVCLVSLLQGCAINNKNQRNEWLGSGQTFINNLSEKPLTEKDIAAGLKEALIISSERVVAQLGKNNGYLNDNAVHIPLPDNLQKVHGTLKRMGLEKYTVELEIKMNRAAEVAVPKVKKLFVAAIKEMRWQDVESIYKGKNDAATQYFKKKMTPALKRMMRPVIHQTLSEVGVVKLYRQAISKYHSISFAPKIKNDLTDYVMQKSISGLFYYLANEEAAIRNNPAKRTTKLLKRMFGH